MATPGGGGVACCLGTGHVPPSSHPMDATLQVGWFGQASIAHVMHCMFWCPCINVDVASFWG